jgi:hypothetical protein
MIVVGSVTGGVSSAGVSLARTNGILSTGSGSFIVHGDAIGTIHSGSQASAAENAGSGGQINGIVSGGATGSAGLGARNCTVSKASGGIVNCHVTDEIILSSSNSISLDANNTFSPTVRIVGFTTLGQTTFNSLLDQDQAAPADVRDKTVYANGALEGTCIIPPKASVALNVPTDDGVGEMPTAAVVAADLLNEMNASALPIAQGLRDGMGASAAAIAAVGSINVIP